MATFRSIPILDLSLARDDNTKSAFLEQLRHALLEVGFLYLKNIGISDDLVQNVKREGIAFFDLPMEEKLRIEMKNAASFLGYSRLGAEITKHAVDHREQIDLSTDHAVRRPEQPLYRNLFSPNQWPSEELLPNFRSVFSEYITQMGAVSIFFTDLIAEAIDLPPNAFHKFFEEDQQHKLKIVKYPDLAELGLPDTVEGQGVGPHKDSMLTSYLLQASEHRGLQVQNSRGEWVDCPPIDGTVVVAIGQGMEALTRGVCKSTTHRVLSPARGSGSRFSIPFFQGVSLDAEFEGIDVPPHMLRLREEARAAAGGWKDDVEFTFTKGRYKHLGEATLMNRIKSHPDVGERWYPDLLKRIREEQQQEKEKGENRQHAAMMSSPVVEAH